MPGRYLASESTIYRILREERLLQHRGRAKAPVRRPPRAHVATGPNQLWSWDITYLKTPVRGVFDYLYLMLDVWSRKIVGWAVHEEESAEYAAALVLAICRAQRLDPAGIVLHADNGGPMKGATMVATLERLGVLAVVQSPRREQRQSLFRSALPHVEIPAGVSDAAVRGSRRGARVGRGVCALVQHRNICTARFALSRPPIGTRGATPPCSSRVAPSTRGLAAGRRRAGAAPSATGRRSPPSA